MLYIKNQLKYDILPKPPEQIEWLWKKHQWKQDLVINGLSRSWQIIHKDVK